MYNIEVHKRVHQLFSVYYSMGLWSERRIGLREWAVKIFYLSIFGFWPISLLLGMYIHEGSYVEKMLSLVFCITGVVVEVRIYFLFFKKKEIIGFVRKLGTHSIKNREEFNKINQDINFLMHFATIFHVLVMLVLNGLSVITLPFIANERKLQFNIYFPFDWRNNEIFYWIAFSYIEFIFAVAIVCTPFTAIVWYLMMSCVCKYKLLGYEFKNIHDAYEESKKNKVSILEEKDLFLTELIALIRKHKSLKETTNEIKSFFSNLYLIQIGTSALSICGSVFILAFTSTDNLVLYILYSYVLVYQLIDIFMVTYYGNEIKFWSSRLSYSLFESNWVDQSKTSRKVMRILMEVLKRPEELVIGKLYPLDLEILNSAYSMFNIFKNIK